MGEFPVLAILKEFAPTEARLLWAIATPAFAFPATLLAFSAFKLSLLILFVTVPEQITPTLRISG
jgi:hypothetical protein